MDAYDKTSTQINRCKRILALVDDYVEKQDAATRTDLRKALMEEFEAPAIAPPVAAGSVDTEKFEDLLHNYRRYRRNEDFQAALNYFKDWGAQQREAGRAEIRYGSESMGQRLRNALERAEKAEADAAFKQACIDRLMLEFCPDEMTPEQVAQWEKHQVRVEPGFKK